MGYVAPVSANRLKGFLFEVITPELCGDLQQFLSALRNELYHPRHGERFTRFSVRFILTDEALTQIRANEEYTAVRGYIETIVPLINGGSIPSGRFIVYFGHNKPSRTNTSDELLSSAANLAAARERAAVHRGFADMRRDAEVNGYTIMTLNQTGIALHHEQIAELLATFNYTVDDIANMLSNTQSILNFGIAKRGREVVSIAASETVDIRLVERGGAWRLRLTELTDAVTKEGHHQHNLYLLTSVALLAHLEHEERTRDGIRIGETNLGSPAVLVTALRQRRHVFSDSGIEPGRFSILPKHANIGGELKNLVVTAIYSNELGELLKDAQR